MAKTEFQAFLDNEVSKVKGVYYPVKAGFLRRTLIRKTAIRNLHPNPSDEFCIPEVGPNYEILSGYEEDYRRIKDKSSDYTFSRGGIREPLMVEKTRPDGYMILNGHHRWAAAWRAGIGKLRIRIVDLTQKKDIQEMIRKAASDRRVTLDLDEVVFRPEGDPCTEKELPFPLNRIFKERLRLGIPALFHSLNANGYDIWVYSAQYYSLDYLKRFFRYYRVRVAGIVTGTAKKVSKGDESRGEMEKLITAQYRTTVHIDNELVFRTYQDSKELEEYRLSGSESEWPREVMETVGKMMQHEKKA